MTNRELLAVGAKPAPGDLAFVQGFVNLMGALKARPDLDGVKVLKTWLVRHGLGGAGTRVNTGHVKIAQSLADGLRGLLIANNDGDLADDAVDMLNRFAAGCDMKIVFDKDGAASLQPGARGAEKALGMLLLVVVDSMATGEWYRLKACREPKCRWVFFDASKNRSGNWCSMAVCGSRAKARAYRRRQGGTS